MPLVNRTISNLFGGVSQQPAGLRLDNQCEEMINAYPSITDGLVKRPPSEFISGLSNSISDLENSMFHTINRDGAEKYIVVFTGDASVPIKIFDLSGNPKTVAYGTLDEDLAFVEDNAKKAYVAGGAPGQDIAAVTVADYTVVVNRAKTVSMQTPDVSFSLPVALVTIPHGISDQTYKVIINGIESASYTAGNSSAPATWKTTAIAEALYVDLNASLDDDWDVSLSGSTIFIVNTAGDDFTFKVEDSWGDQAMVGIKESVQRFEDLPAILPGSISHDYDVVTVGGTGSHHNGYFYIFVEGVMKAAVHSNDDPLELTTLYLYNQLLVNLCSDPVFRVSRDVNKITIWRTDNVHATVTISATGGAPDGSPFLTMISHTSVDLSGTVFAVKPDPTTQNGTYYVRWNSSPSGGKTTSGNWEECPKRGIATKFNPATMPHRLVRIPNGTFVFASISWEDREVGDELSAPDPTYMGSQINDVFFFKSRLGFLSKGSSILSKAGEFFDFFPTTATDVLDDDPIDAECSSKQVAVLRYGIPFQSQLVLFSDQQQFSLGSGAQLFTPKSAAADLATSVAVDRCEPVSIGSNIYFASPSGNYTSIREMFVAADTLITDSADVTAHCPSYIPAHIKKLSACEGKDTVFVLSSDEPNALYVYKFYWNGDQKAQSAWSKWTFGSEIMYMDVIDNYLYLLFMAKPPPPSSPYISDTIGADNGDYFFFTDSNFAFLTEFPELVPGDRISVSGFDNADFNVEYTVISVFAGILECMPVVSWVGFDQDEAAGNMIAITRVILESYTSDTIGMATGGFILQDFSSQFLAEFPDLAPGDMISVSGFDNPDYNMVFEVESVDSNTITCVNPFSEYKGGEFSGIPITITLTASASAFSGSMTLERINLETKEATESLKYRVLLDRQKVLVGSFDTDHTNFTSPYPVISTDRAFNKTTKECVDITVINGAAGTFSVPGNWSGAVVIFGRPYMLDFRFSEFGMKSSDPKVYSRAGRGQLRTMNLSFEETMAFDIVVSTPGRPDTTQRFRASAPVTGEKRFMTLGDTRTTRVSIRSDSHLPCKFGGASYETMYAQRSR